VALGDQGLRQRLDHIRKTARLRKWQPFRCYKKNSHSLLFTRWLRRASCFSLFRRIHGIDRVLRMHFTLLDPIPAVKTEAWGQKHKARFLLHFWRMARQRFGQHFLADPGWRKEIARAIGVSPHSATQPATAPAKRKDSTFAISSLEDRAPVLDQPHCWIEVGAGHGEMTEHLAATGAPVYAVEIDALLIARLQRLTKKFPNLAVIPGDVLETDLAALAAGRRIRIYGNLPYYITSPILHHFFRFVDQIDEIHIVIQEEVALRLVAKPQTKQYGYLSVATQLYARPEFVLRIPCDAFSPPPEVGSALVTLRLPGERAKLDLPDEEVFLDFVKSCFSQKRKTLVNNLRSLAKPDIVREALASQSLRPDARAEQLSVSQLAALHTALAASA
jgi:16S rRNA (adenine1518-N6/adenine1519-N6)-dimethyltransferase